MPARENPYARFEPSTEAADTGDSQLEEYLEHLKHYPLDCEIREHIAVMYADLYGRFDLAVEQLQQMIELPNQPMRNVVRWLNLLADIQVRLGADLLAVQATLHRIINLDSHAAAATLARNRISRLKLEIKGKEQSQALKIGSYEQNIGLKRSFPRQR